MTLAVDQTLRYFHLKPILNVLAKNGLDYYGFEIRDIINFRLREDNKLEGYKTKTMSKRAKQYVLNCRILQNGRPIKDFQTNYGENKQLSATSNGDDPLGITNYPLSRPISIVNSSKNGTYIEIDHPWEGYIISEGELNTVNGYHDLGKSFKITPGDLVSLGWHDLRFFKIEKKSIAQKNPFRCYAEKTEALCSKRLDRVRTKQSVFIQA